MNESRKELGVWFWIGLVFGWAVIAFGIYTMFKNKAPDNPTYTFELGFGSNIVHDAIIAPATVVVAWVLARIIPLPWRRAINWGLFSTAVVAAIAYPAVRGLGRKADNPTVEPLDYATALATVVGVIWSVVVVLLLAQAIAMYRLRKSRASR